MIENAKMPLLLIGAGANRKQAQEALTYFIETTGIRFFQHLMSPLGSQSTRKTFPTTFKVTVIFKTAI